jgi:predicted MFS family arabinose efflux permease
MILAASNARPERIFGLVNAISLIYSGIFLWLAPKIEHAWGLAGVFVGVAILALVVSPSVIFARSLSVEVGSPQLASARRARLFNPATLMLLAMILMLYIGHGAIWAYQERIGVRAGLSRQQAGQLLGISMLVWGVGGSLLASIVGLKMGRVWPQVISLGVSTLAAILLVSQSGALAYAIACALIAASWFFGLAYQLGLLALSDPGGRNNIAGVVMTTTGAALGPTFAALLLGYGGFRAVGFLAAACFCTCLALVLLSLRRVATPRDVPA